jgi:RNA polymerase sigma factor (sigma-70 family)
MGKPFTYKSDEALLKDLRNGAPPAFETLYRQYYRMVYKQVSDAGREAAEAEDLFQEVLVVLVRKIREPEFQLSAKLSTFLYAIARNLLLKGKPGKLVELSPENMAMSRLHGVTTAEEPEIRTKHEAQLNVIAGYLELLEDDCSRLLKLSFYEKYSQAKIAETMGYTESFVKVKKYRCLDYLRKKVKQHPLFQHLQPDE